MASAAPSDEALDAGYPSYVPVDQSKNLARKQRVMAIMQQLIDAPCDELGDAIRDGYDGNARVNVTHPVDELGSLRAVAARFWAPLRRAVRYAEGHELRDGKIARSYIFVDFLDLMRQVGYWPIAPSLGREMQWLSPMTHGGVILTTQDDGVSRRTDDLIRRMHTSLGVYTDGRPLTRETMALIEAEDARHFHPNFLWYGPAGIGTTRGIKGFDGYHGHSFVMAFPDRGGGMTPHFIRISDGHFAVTGGWGHLEATHTGNDFLGIGPTGKHVAMHVMDFYRCDDETICENWVPIDIPHLLWQMGVDVFGRMRLQLRQSGKLDAKAWLLRE